MGYNMAPIWAAHMGYNKGNHMDPIWGPYGVHMVFANGFHMGFILALCGTYMGPILGGLYILLLQSCKSDEHKMGPIWALNNIPGHHGRDIGTKCLFQTVSIWYPAWSPNDRSNHLVPKISLIYIEDTNVGPIWAAHMGPIMAAHMGCTYGFHMVFANGIHVGPIWAALMSLTLGLYESHMGSIWVL